MDNAALASKIKRTMLVQFSFLKGIVAATAVVVLGLGVVQAQEADLRDEAEILERLRDAEPADAHRLEAQLKALWSQSGSASMDLLLRRGQDAIESGDIEAAIDHLTALTDHAPDFAEGWYARATAYYMLDLFGPSVSDLERALALNPNHFEALMGLGVILEEVGRVDLAVQAFEQAASIHPHHDAVIKALERLGPQAGGQSL